MAQKFRFRLETVLDVRKHEEQLQKQEFAKRLQKKVSLEVQRRKIEEELNAYTNNPRFGIGKNHFEFIQSQQSRIFNLNNRILKAKEELEIERQKLLDARRKTLALENLESKQKAMHLKELERLEQLQMNEIASQRFNRNRG